MPISKGISGLLAAAGLTALACAGWATAQTPAAPVARFSAETANLAAGPEAVRIDILAWSTDAERRALVDAWNMVRPTAGRARDGDGRGRRGGAAAAPPGAPVSPARGRGARGARGGPPAGATAAPTAAPATPDEALAAALQSSAGVGYLWTSESVGYSLRHAFRLPQADGGVRIVLATDRRLGSFDGSWKPAAGAPNDYPFSVIELRLSSAMEGEGKASLTGAVSVDGAANTIALEDYAALPVTLRNVRPASPAR